MAIARKLFALIVVVSLGIGVAAGTGVADPVEAVSDEVCEPDPTNVTQNETISQEELMNESQKRNISTRRNGTDEELTVIDGGTLAQVALEQIAPDTECDVQF